MRPHFHFELFPRVHDLRFSDDVEMAARCQDSRQTRHVRDGLGENIIRVRQDIDAVVEGVEACLQRREVGCGWRACGAGSRCAGVDGLARHWRRHRNRARRGYEATVLRVFVSYGSAFPSIACVFPSSVAFAHGRTEGRVARSTSRREAAAAASFHFRPPRDDAFLTLTLLPTMAASTDASASTTPSRTRGKAAASASTSTAAAPRKRNLTGDSAQSPSRNSKRLKRDTAANSDDDEADGSDASESGEVNAPPTVSSLTTLPPDVLQVHLPRQRSAVLHRLAGHVRSPSQLTGLSEQSAALSVTLTSTVKRGESNSILLVGGKGSGKSALLDATLAGMPHGSYHHVRISALQCTTDRSAMRELARQLIQTGALGLDAEQQLGMAQGDGDGDGDGDEDEGHDADGDDASQDGGSDEGSDAGDDVDADADADEKAALGTAVLVRVLARRCQPHEMPLR